MYHINYITDIYIYIYILYIYVLYTIFDIFVFQNYLKDEMALKILSHPYCSITSWDNSLTGSDCFCSFAC